MKKLMIAAVLISILSACSTTTVVKQKRDEINMKHAVSAGIGAVLSGASLVTGILSGDVPGVVSTILGLPLVGLDAERATHDVRIYSNTE